MRKNVKAEKWQDKKETFCIQIININNKKNQKKYLFQILCTPLNLLFTLNPLYILKNY